MALSLSRAALAAALAALALPSAAAAGTIEVVALSDPGASRLIVGGDAVGKANLSFETVAGTPTQLVITSIGNTVTESAANCALDAPLPDPEPDGDETPAPEIVRCALASPLDHLDVDLRGLDAGDTAIELGGITAGTLSSASDTPITVALQGSGSQTVDGDGDPATATDDVPYGLDVTTGSGDDHVIGGAAGDIINTGAGADSAWGGAGNDRIDLHGGGDATTGEYAEGGDGDDTLIGGAGVEWLIGDAGNDTLFGDDEDNNLTLAGGADDDRLDGGEGNDTLHGGDGEDRLDGEGGEDSLEGHGGADELLGGDANDLFYPGDGDDRAEGGPGDDVFWGSDGDDAAYGDDGNDRFDATEDAGSDVFDGGGNRALDQTEGATGDYVTYEGRLQAVTAALPNGDDLSHDNGQAGEDDRLAGIESAVGGKGDDELHGNDGPNQLYGGAGRDLLVGAAGADVLIGGGDIDHIDARVADGTPDVDAVIFCTGYPDAEGEPQQNIVSLDQTDVTPDEDCSNRAPGLSGELKIVGDAKIGQKLSTTGVTAFDNDAASGAVVVPTTKWFACSDDGCDLVGEGPTYTVTSAAARRFINAEVSVTREFDRFWTGDARSAGIDTPVPAPPAITPGILPPNAAPPVIPAPKPFEQAAIEHALQQLGAGATQLRLPQLAPGQLVFQAPAVKKKTLTFDLLGPTPVFGIACLSTCKVTITQTVLLPASAQQGKAKQLKLKTKKLTASGPSVSPITFAASKAQRKLIAANKQAKLTLGLSFDRGKKKPTKVTKTFTLKPGKKKSKKAGR